MKRPDGRDSECGSAGSGSAMAARPGFRLSIQAASRDDFSTGKADLAAGQDVV